MIADWYTLSSSPLKISSFWALFSSSPLLFFFFFFPPVILPPVLSPNSALPATVFLLQMHLHDYDCRNSFGLHGGLKLLIDQCQPKGL